MNNCCKNLEDLCVVVGSFGPFEVQFSQIEVVFLEEGWILGALPASTRYFNKPMPQKEDAQKQAPCIRCRCTQRLEI